MYLQWKLSEEEWAQLEEAASCVQVVKVKVDVRNSAKGSRALATGFSKNPILREVELWRVPKELVESVREILCTNSALTVKLR